MDHPIHSSKSDNSSVYANSPLLADSLAVRYRSQAALVIEDIDLRLPEHKVTAIIGPNGSGKSTLLKALSRELSPARGGIIINGKDLQTLGPRDLAKQLGILFQDNTVPGGLTVERLVMHGRYPHRRMFESPTERDRDAVASAMKLAGVDPWAHREVRHLSGGQQQLVWIAVAIAQEPGILLLDEPTTFLDLRHQLDILHLVQRLRDEHEKTIVLVVHDINHALGFADHLIVMHKGRVVASGEPEQVVTEQLLYDVFEVQAHIIEADNQKIVSLPRQQP